MGLYVRAKVIKGEPKAVAGYYGVERRYEGQTFELRDPKDFSEKWMERLDPEEAKAAAPKIDYRTKAGKEHREMHLRQLGPE